MACIYIHAYKLTCMLLIHVKGESPSLVLPGSANFRLTRCEIIRQDFFLFKGKNIFNLDFSSFHVYMIFQYELLQGTYIEFHHIFIFRLSTRQRAMFNEICENIF